MDGKRGFRWGSFYILLNVGGADTGQLEGGGGVIQVSGVPWPSLLLLSSLQRVLRLLTDLHRYLRRLGGNY